MEQVDLLGNVLHVGDLVYYAGASTSRDFAKAHILEITQYGVKLGKTRYRSFEQVIKA